MFGAGDMIDYGGVAFVRQDDPYRCNLPDVGGAVQCPGSKDTPVLVAGTGVSPLPGSRGQEYPLSQVAFPENRGQECSLS